MASMARTRLKRTWRIDWPLLCIVAFMVVFGLIMMYSASSTHGIEGQDRAPGYFLVRQLRALGVGLAALLVGYLIPYRLYQRLAVPIVLAVVLFLGGMAVLGLLKGGTRADTNRWLMQAGGSSSVQPTEMLRIGIQVYLAAWLAAKGSRIQSVRLGLAPFGLLLGVMAGFVLAQPDLSSAVVVVLSALAMFYVAGAKWWQIGVLLLLAALAAFFVVFVVGYNLERWELFWLDPFEHPVGSNIHMGHAAVALRRGGLTGVGLGHGDVKYRLYACHSDLLLSVIGEELGLLGTSLVVAVFALWTVQGLRVAMSAPDTFSSLLALGLVLWVTFEGAMHIGVSARLLIPTGTVLPFMSSGGSSLVSNLAAVGILLNISAAGGLADREARGLDGA